MRTRRWLISAAIALALVVLGLTARGWLPPLLRFVGANSDLIQGLADLTQIVLWVGAGVSLFVGWWRGRKEHTIHEPGSATFEETFNSRHVEAENAVVATEGSAAAGHTAVVARDVQGDVVIHAPDLSWETVRRLAPGKNLEQETAEYVQYLTERYRYLDFMGLGVSERVPLQLPLVEMYVPLRARVDLPKGETWERRLRVAGRGEPEDRLERSELIRDLLQQHQGLIVLGDPGAGKTTLLKYVTLLLAAGQGEELGLGSRLPILVPLSAYATALADKNVRLDEFVARHYYQKGADLSVGAVLDEALRQGKAMVLLDGLDEVKETGLRQTVVRRVVDFFLLHRRAGNRFVLTSRIIGYREVRCECEGLVECTLEDLREEDIQAFVDKWTAALEKAARGDTRIAELEAKRERQELMEAVQRNPGVRGLAANPLLLTILALMKRQGMTLPDRRAKLYDKYVCTLISSWNRARGLDRAPVRELDENEIVRILAPLALWMHEENPGAGLVKLGDLERKLEAIYAQRPVPDPEQAARQFLSDVREFAGILLERGTETYGFIHLTFEEYLAAVGIARQGQRDIRLIVDGLARRVGEGAWREVFSLTIGYLGLVAAWEELASDVALALLERAPGQPGEVIAWVGDAVADAWPGGVTPQCKERVVRALVEAVGDDTRVAPAMRVAPAVRAAAGNALARLGDPRPGVGLRPDGLPDLAWCEVPAGEFWMGSDEKDSQAYRYEKPRHPVRLPAFRIARYPITNAQYQAFVDEGGYTRPEWQACWTEAGRRWKGERAGPERYGGDFDLSNHPVVNVTWYEALAFCRWLTLRLREAGEIGEGEEVRLPSEAEWEKAARGAEGRIYPWGREADPNRANYDQTGIGATSAVGCFPGGESPYGCQEMSGNVWEWCATRWEESYRGYKGDDNPEGEAARVLRGGSWDNTGRDARCAIRGRFNPDFWDSSVGFRVSLSLAGSGS